MSRQEVGDWHLWRSETQAGLDRWRAGLQYSLTGLSCSYKTLWSWEALQSCLEIQGGSWGSPALTLYWKKFIPSPKDEWLFAAEGCVRKVVTVTWHPQSHPLHRLMIQMLSTMLSKSKYSINVGSYHHQYHPPDIPHPPSCKKNTLLCLWRGQWAHFLNTFPNNLPLSSKTELKYMPMKKILFKIESQSMYNAALVWDVQHSENT